MLPKIQNSNSVSGEGRTVTFDAGKMNKVALKSFEKMAKAQGLDTKVKPISKPKKYINDSLKKTKQSLSSITDIASFFDFLHKENSSYHEEMEAMEKNDNELKQNRHKEIMDVLISATKKKTEAEKKIKKEVKKKVEEPKAETKPTTKTEPKAEAPKAEAPKAEAPKPATQPAPKAETAKPVAEAPKPVTQPAQPKVETAKPVTTPATPPPTAAPAPAAPPVPKPATTTSKPVTEVAKQATAQAVAKAGAPQITKIVEMGKGYNVVQLANGQVVKQEGTWNWRNNNPGNIEYGTFALGMGAIPFAHGKDKPQTPEERFAVFPTYEIGRKAKEKLIFEQQKSSHILGPYGDLTVDKAILKYAPPFANGKKENETADYQNTVKSALKKLGVTDDIIATRKMKEYTPEQRMAILDAMEKQEGYGVGKKTTTNVPTSTNLADKLNQTSTENSDMKKSMSQTSGGTTILQVNNASEQKKIIQLPEEKKKELNPTMQ